MSTENAATTKSCKSMSVPQIMNRKHASPLVCLTAYSTPQAQLIDDVCDIVLVGDSVAMVVHGLPSTIDATLDMMILHGAAVRRGLKHALMVVDMPFGSYEASPEIAFQNAAKVMQATGCNAVKVEGGSRMAPTIEFLTSRGIPVMAHIGLTPQSVQILGGYKLQGVSEKAATVEQDAQDVASAGAFSVVLEKIPEVLAAKITNNISIPTIGIGASPDCDGQILVIDDMLGMFTSFRPKFVRKYADIGNDIRQAVSRYASDVRSRTFPDQEHTFKDSRSSA